MNRALGNAVVAAFGVVAVLVLFPSPVLARPARRLADRLIVRGWLAAYAVADWVGGHRPHLPGRGK